MDAHTFVCIQATTDGSTMTTHTVDCAECDWRISKVRTIASYESCAHVDTCLFVQVPAQDWPEGSMRPVYLYRSGYPQKGANLEHVSICV
jgi:hypothetical protein